MKISMYFNLWAFIFWSFHLSAKLSAERQQNSALIFPENYTPSVMSSTPALQTSSLPSPSLSCSTSDFNNQEYQWKHSNGTFVFSSEAKLSSGSKEHLQCFEEKEGNLEVISLSRRPYACENIEEELSSTINDYSKVIPVKLMNNSIEILTCFPNLNCAKYWLKDKKEPNKKLLDSGNLLILRGTEIDSGTYECLIYDGKKNVKISGRKYYVSFEQSSMNNKVSNKVVYKSEDVFAEEGSELTLYCIFHNTNLSKKSSVKWILPKKKLGNFEEKINNDENFEGIGFHILSATVEHSGTYQCYNNLDFHKNGNKPTTYEIKVDIKPKKIRCKEELTNKKIFKQEPLSISCNPVYERSTDGVASQVSCAKKEVVVRWFINGKVVESGNDPYNLNLNGLSKSFILGVELNSGLRKKIVAFYIHVEELPFVTKNDVTLARSTLFHTQIDDQKLKETANMSISMIVAVITCSVAVVIIFFILPYCCVKILLRKRRKKKKAIEKQAKKMREIDASNVGLKDDDQKHSNFSFTEKIQPNIEPPLRQQQTSFMPNNFQKQKPKPSQRKHSEPYQNIPVTINRIPQQNPQNYYCLPSNSHSQCFYHSFYEHPMNFYQAPPFNNPSHLLTPCFSHQASNIEWIEEQKHIQLHSNPSKPHKSSFLSQPTRRSQILESDTRISRNENSFLIQVSQTPQPQEINQQDDEISIRSTDSGFSDPPTRVQEGNVRNENKNECNVPLLNNVLTTKIG